MLNLIQTEFLRLRRRRTGFWMLLAAWLMPLVGVFYFGDDCRLGLDPIRFFKWASFSYTAWIVLPIVLGIFASMLMVDENRLGIDRKSTRLNSSHHRISYAVFCLKKKKK